MKPIDEGVVTSPCTSVCRMNARTGLCEGCLRTIDEIATWGSMDNAHKRALLLRLEARRDVALGATQAEESKR